MREQSERTHVRRHHRWPLVTGLVVLALLVALVAFLAIDGSAVANAVTQRMLPKVSQTIGRQVTVGHVSLALFPRPAVRLENVQVAGAPGEPVFVQAGEVRAIPRLWKLLVSRGHEVDVRDLELDDATVNLVRRASGKWSPTDIQDKLAKKEPAPPEKRTVLLDHIRLHDAKVQVVDLTHGKGAAAARVAMSGIDATLAHVGPGQPLEVKLNAALASTERNFSLDAKVDPLPAGPLTDRANLPKITGSLKIAPLDLASLETFLSPDEEAMFRGGNLRFDARITTRGPGEYALESNTNVDNISLRGAPAAGTFHLVAAVDGMKPDAATVHVDKLHLTGGGIDVGGTVDGSMQPLKVRFALTGPLLDLDELLATLPSNGRPGPAAAHPKKTNRTTLAGADVQGSLHFDLVRSRKLTANDLDAKATLQDGVLVLTEGRARVYGGEVALDGTRIDLRPEVPEWRLAANLTSLDLGSAMNALSGASPLLGKFNGHLDVHGAGENWQKVRSDLTGNGNMSLTDGALTTLDLASQVATPLSAALRTLGQPAAAGKVGGLGGKTAFKNVGGSFAVQDGWLAFQSPISFETPLGAVQLHGRVGLDQQLDLTGTVQLTPQTVAQLTGGTLAGNTAIPVPLRIGGTLKAPSVAPIDPGALAKQLAGSKVQQGTQQLQKSLENEAQKRLKGLGF